MHNLNSLRDLDALMWFGLNYHVLGLWEDMLSVPFKTDLTYFEKHLRPEIPSLKVTGLM